MKRVFLTLILVLSVLPGLEAQTTPDAAELTKLLKEFLAGAGRNDAAVHDRFWAEDLIYTGSSGRRRGKEELMRDVRSEPAPKPNEPTTVYTAEDIRIQQYGETAVVAFRLVATTEKEGAKSVRNFFNTGTFLKREGAWRAAAWQATTLPLAEEEAKKEVTAAAAAFHRAILGGDVKAVESLTAESFVWTNQRGEQKNRQQVIGLLTAKQLKYAEPETKDAKIALYRDTAIVRGASAQPSKGGAEPATAYQTLTFVYQDGDWKAVALHSSEP